MTVGKLNYNLFRSYFSLVSHQLFISIFYAQMQFVTFLDFVFFLLEQFYLAQCPYGQRGRNKGQ